LGGAPPARAYDEYEFAVRDRAKEPFDERGAKESRRPGDGDAPSGEIFTDHNPLSTRW
jgi:hypothetical protein